MAKLLTYFIYPCRSISSYFRIELENEEDEL